MFRRSQYGRPERPVWASQARTRFPWWSFLPPSTLRALKAALIEARELLERRQEQLDDLINLLDFPHRDRDRRERPERERQTRFGRSGDGYSTRAYADSDRFSKRGRTRVFTRPV